MVTKRLFPYVAAPVSVFVATLLRLALHPVVGSSVPFITFFTAALLLAWFYGFGPAALAIALSVIAGGHYIVAAGSNSFMPVDRAGRAAVVGFATLSLTVSYLLDFQHRTLNRARLAEKEQRRANEELARMNQDLEAFAYAASHDLQEPLRMVKVFSEQLVRRYDDKDPEAQQFVGFVRLGVTRMEQLIRGLLHFSRVSHADGVPEGSLIDLTASLNDAVTILKVLLAESGGTVTADPLPQVHGDQGQLTQVFQNLLSNALTYRRAGEPPRIHVAAKPDNNMWIVSVQDNGIGFDQEYADRIFGLFKRLHKDEYPGTGVGLAICKRIVERYGGRIWATGNPGAGAIFYFALAGKEFQ